MVVGGVGRGAVVGSVEGKKGEEERGSSSGGQERGSHSLCGFIILKVFCFVFCFCGKFFGLVGLGRFFRGLFLKFLRGVGCWSEVK